MNYYVVLVKGDLPIYLHGMQLRQDLVLAGILETM